MERIVLITGSTRGIGEATAAAFLKNGDKVAIFCRHQEHVSEAAIRLSAHGDKAHILPLVGDVREPRDVRRIVEECIAAFGHIDVLINNAGIAVWKPVAETTEAEWDAVVDTNLKGAFLCIKEAMPYLQKQGKGIIINISSGLGAAGQAKYSAYSSSKFGLIGLTECVADELHGSDVKAYAVLPGAVATKLHLDIHPWERAEDMMTPEHVAERIFEVAKGKRRNGASIEVYS